MNDTLNLEWLKKLKPELFVNLAHAFVSIAIILICCIILMKLINRLLRKLSEKQFISAPFLIVLQSVLRWLVYVVIFLLILQQLGVSLNSVWTVLSAVVAMIAIGFVAVWSVLSNLLCTVMLLIFQPFRIGDEIEIIDPAMTAGVRGRVRNINLIFTTLEVRDADSRYRTTYHVPNNLLFQKIIRSKSGSETFNLDQQIFERHSLLERVGEADGSTTGGDAPR